jgi:hypothetical protein
MEMSNYDPDEIDQIGELFSYPELTNTLDIIDRDAIDRAESDREKWVQLCWGRNYIRASSFM